MRLFSRDLDSQELRDTFQVRLYALLAGLLLIVGYVIAFVVENDKQVDVDFVLVSASVSLIWVIVLSLVIGILAGLVLSQLYRRRSSRS